MASLEVDVYGIENVLSMFDLHKCEDFAVFTGASSGTSDKWRLKFAATGKDIFQVNVQSIDPMNDATYQVRFYKKDFDEDAITPGTPYSSSYNFKVKPRAIQAAPAHGAANAWTGLSVGDTRYMAFLEAEINRLKEELYNANSTIEDLNDSLQEYEDKGKKKLGDIGMAGEALEQYPLLAEMFKPLVAGISNFLNGRAGMPPQNTGYGLGNIQSPSNTPPAMTPDEVKQTFENAVTKMNGYYVKKYGQVDGDRLFAQDLQKLADLTDKPFIFEAALDQLRKL
jgi:hypothetical protein